MAKTGNVLDPIIVSSGPDEMISKMVQQPDIPFVEAYEEKWRNPFEFPAWCRLEEFAYGWMDKKDEVNWDRYITSGLWRLVKRDNHPDVPDSAFRLHGAVERRSCLLVYRPLDLEAKIRNVAVRDHLAHQRTLEEKFDEGQGISGTDRKGKPLAKFYRPKEGAKEEVMWQEKPAESFEEE